MMLKIGWLLLFFALLTFQASASDNDRPTILAFVVGVENYSVPELNKLTYAADDARDVYKQLSVIANLSPDSQLLVADDQDGSQLSDEALRDAVAKFARKIKDGTNVVVYLGGHGTLSPTRELWYLPSNYDPEEQINNLPFDDILRYFADQVRGKLLSDVKITFFLNVCGAGNANTLANPGLRTQAVVDQESLEFTRDVIRKVHIGELELAIVPATPRNRNAFEDDQLKRSRFAYHLLEGLKGAAAGPDGALTSGDIFTYVESKLGEELPKNSPFASDIPIGLTSEIEGQAELALGTVLFGAARSVGLADPDDPAARRQERLLLDLSADRFGRVGRRSPALTERARLRATQTALISQGDATDLMAEPIQTRLLSESEKEEATFLAKPNKQSFPTLADLRDFIRTNSRTKVVLVSSQRSDQVVNADPMEPWKAFLSFLPKENVERWTFPLLFNRNDSRIEAVAKNLFAKVKLWRAEDDAQREGNGAALLIVVFAGANILDTSNTNPSDCLNSNAVSICALLPFGHTEINAIQQIWDGPMVFVHAASYGGSLLNGISSDVSLLLAAEERNGITLSGSSDLLLDALGQGVENLTTFSPLSQFREATLARAAANRNQRESSIRVVPGTPAWHPSPRKNYRMIATDQIEPLTRLAFHVFAGCLTEGLKECDEVAKSSLKNRDVLSELEAAAASDLAGDRASAARRYLEVSSVLSSLAATPVLDRLGAHEANAALSHLQGLVKKRAGGALGKASRHIWILPAGVADYKSPLVADVPYSIEDLEQYASRLKAMLEIGLTDVDVLPIARPRTADELLTQLRSAREKVEGRTQDLIIFVFSGRGLVADGRYKLAMSDVEAHAESDLLCENLGECVEQNYFDWSPEHLVDLADIAHTASGAWFLAIYDTQFTKPYSDLSRLDQLLDKQIDSVRPRKEASEPTVDGEAATINLLSRGNIPARQVHLWLEGRLTQGATQEQECLTDTDTPPHVASPFAGALLSNLPPDKPTTYRNWLVLLAGDPCLTAGGQVLTMQGDIDVPLLASGEGAEFVEHFQSGEARRTLNLEAALAVSQEADARFPSARNKLAEAALLVSLAQMNGRYATLLGIDDKLVQRLEKAENLLLSIADADLLDGDADLRPIKVELLSLAVVLQGDSTRARDILMRTEPTILSQRSLARELVIATRDALRTQPNVLLSKVAEKLARLQKQGSGSAADAELDALLREERSLRPTVYSISESTPIQPGSSEISK
ncbi:hypothetical protein JOH50_006682 [Rhizobium leguminosarum]|uniref:caspase family protein n=1 Tax=Rhizobium leguminosarum TaxID=384 RepID=UPI001AE29D31|nr:caspase family protein [Rhizobium leguminosarum]MBP2490886.1 hypothetical protein [Rhizobium leguminosarum]